MAGVIDSKANLLIFMWRIENYSFCWHEENEPLFSPVFVSDVMQGAACKLELHPAGSKHEKKNIGLFVRRVPNGLGSKIVRVNFDVSIISSNGSVLKSSGKKAIELMCSDGMLGDSRFMKRDEVLIQRRSEYLPQDVLTVRCTMWKNSVGTFPVCQQISARTRIAVERISRIHTLEGFSSLLPDEKKTLRIEPSSQGRPGMTMSTFVTGEYFGEEKVVVEVVPADTGKIPVFTCRLHLVDAEGKRTECGRADNRFDRVERGFLNVPLSFSRQALMLQKDKYLPNDTLTVRCEWDFSFGSESTEVEGTDSEPRSIPSSGTTDVKFPACRSVLEDLRSLYNDPSLSDVRLKTETETFHAHRAVLAARSSVFKAMLAGDMKEKMNQCVEVEDLEDDVVRRMLLFFYTDDLEDLSWDLATKLYYAADKYDVQPLMAKCSVFLLDNLNISNAVELLVLADTHQDSRLKTPVVDFILDHDKEMFGSGAWMTFMDTNPTLALKTMHLKYTK